MSITLGSYSNLPNTLLPDGCQQDEVEKSAQWVMADGSVHKHSISLRWRWRLSWDVGATDFGNLQLAYAVAVGTASSFKPPDTSTTWTVVASGWKATPYSVLGGTIRYKVSFTVEETTA